ncbi:MAG: 16S rRNA (cytidine(1402)-2'-O)-methyltransferase [Gammaproteobacteria bacterium]|nr:16S rRNA (cytidine(1402)-2'-O)-methyltransferase [Gammaproteobacteria bacterium]
MATTVAQTTINMDGFIIMIGNLYVVATPIGNLQDFSSRGARLLSSVKMVAAEDTRRARTLLAEIGCDNVMITALHEHNEKTQLGDIIKLILDGNDIALVSDAGTPLLSDPGFLLVRECWRMNIPVLPVPGPSAVVSALSICPIPAERFYFHGFLSSKSTQRRSQIEGLLARREATVFFEAPHRVEHCLADFLELAPERKMMLAREMTKLYESYEFGSASDLLTALRKEDAFKGEFVFVLEGETNDIEHPWENRLLVALVKEVGPSRAAKIVGQLSGKNRRELYQKAISLPE